VIASRLHHVSFTVRDIDAARRFYGGVLGFPEIERPGCGVPGAWFEIGDVQVHLIVPPEGAPVDRPPPSLSPVAGHAAFQIEDYEAVRATLRERGVEVLETGPAVGQLFVRDPDGNVIELIRKRLLRVRLPGRASRPAVTGPRGGGAGASWTMPPGGLEA